VVVLAACASVDPRGAFDSTAAVLAERGVSGVTWMRDEPARRAALERSRELLAAPLTADSAAEVALLRKPGLQATLERLGVAQADLAQATRLANPGFSFATLSGGGHEQRTTTVVGDVVAWLVQPLRRKLAEAELERIKLEVSDAVLEAATGARVALASYQAAEQLASRLAKIEEIERAAADFAGVLFDAGNLSERERANARAGWAESAADLDRARAEAARRHEEVVRALGLDDGEEWSAPPELAQPPEIEIAPAVLQARAARDRLDLAAARWAVDALGRALALKKRTRFFPVGVELGVERERDIAAATITGPTIELRLPIFDTGAASVARLESELAAARWQLEALSAFAASQVREKARDLAAAHALAASYRDTVLPLRLTVLEQTLREFNQMLVGTFEVLAAKRAEVEAERAYVGALADYWIARAELERAIAGPLAPEEER
jgi:cobalt-zinc-cadmium efflux system outer membrane protein